MHHPEQPVDWDHLLDEFGSSLDISFESTFIKTMQFLVMCGMSDREEALAFQVWHEHESIFNMICAADFKWGEHNFHVISRIQARVAHFEEELPKLKEITTILELALWKMRMKENILQGEATHCQKKIKIDESDI